MTSKLASLILNRKKNSYEKKQYGGENCYFFSIYIHFEAFISEVIWHSNKCYDAIGKKGTTSFVR